MNTLATLLSACLLTSLLQHCAGLVPSTSPCPSILTYDATNVQDDRWFATANLASDVQLTGYTLTIVLNKKVHLLGNYVSQVSSTDNQEFTIQNFKQRISPGSPISVRFFVKFNEAETIPEVQEIRLNGREICSSGAPIPAPVTPMTPRPPRLPPSATPTIQPTSPTRINPDYFDGDRPGSGFPLIPNNIACGTVESRAIPLITGGQPTIRGEWPWHVAVYQSTGDSLKYICGGSLISRTTVVTAAHCVTRISTNIAVNPQRLLIGLGKFNLKQSFPGEVTKSLSQIIVHPRYNHSFFYSDIAVVKFDTPVEYNSFIRPICLWDPSNTDLSTVLGFDGTVVGWGYDESGAPTDLLSKAHMPVVDELTCLKSNFDFFSRFVNDTSYCGGFRNGTSACNGDSGGGMVFSTAAADGTVAWRLRGLVSLSVALQNKYVCDTNHYVIFTDVAKFVPWLQENMN